MAESQNIQPTGSSDDAARIAALEKYIADPPPPSLTNPETTSGIVLHFPFRGSLSIPLDAAQAAGLAALVLFFVGGAVFLGCRNRHNRRRGSE